MVNNIVQARPLSGLSEAKILVEILLEGGITRFMALYEDYMQIPQTGPVRSARDQFFQLLVPAQGFYVHVGDSTVQQSFLETENHTDFNMDGNLSQNLIEWDSQRQAEGFAQENTAYTDGERMARHIQENQLDDNLIALRSYLNFAPYTQEARIPQGGSAPSVFITHSERYGTVFNYDAGSSRYQMSQYNWISDTVEPTVDEGNGQRLAFDNLLILFTDIQAYPGLDGADLQQISFGMGAGVYVSQSAYEPVIWKKGGTPEALQILSPDKNETPVLINPGTSYIAFVSLDEWDIFYQTLSLGHADS